MKIAIMGQLNTIIGWQTVGLEAYPISTLIEARQQLKDLTKTTGIAILLITEDWYQQLEPEITKIQTALPAIIPIPSAQASNGQSLKNLNKIVERAVGSNIFN